MKLIIKIFAAIGVDLIIFWVIGALIIMGFTMNNEIKMDFMYKYMLGSLSALYWVFLYTVFLPFNYFNGQTLGQKIFKVGIKMNENKKLSYTNLFLMHGAVNIVLVFTTLGISALISFLLKIFYKKKSTIEELFCSFKYIDLRETQHINIRKNREEEVEEIVKRLKTKKIKKKHKRK